MVDDNPQTVTELNIKRSFLGPEFEGQDPRTDESLAGTTCAACHTANIHYGEKVIRIDGGAAMADVQAFLVELSDALSSAIRNDIAFERFAHVVMEKSGTGYSLGGTGCPWRAHEELCASLSQACSTRHGQASVRLRAFGCVRRNLK